MFCPRCRDRISETWIFCPRCGARLPSSGQQSPPEPHYSAFAEVFKDIERQMKEALGSNLSKDVEFFDLRPEFFSKHPYFRTGGFRVKITRAGDGPPNIDIKAFGDMDEKLAEKMRESIKPPAEPQVEKKVTDEEPSEHVVEESQAPRAVSEYCEPSCATKWAGDHLLVELELPGVKKSEDVEVRKLSESIEIRAYAGNKGYFKILGIPGEAKVIGKRFRAGKLSLKIG